MMTTCKRCGKECGITKIREDCDDGVAHSLVFRNIYFEVSDCCGANISDKDDCTESFC